MSNKQIFRHWWNRYSETKRFLIGFGYGRTGTSGEPMLYIIDAAQQKVSIPVGQIEEFINALQHVRLTMEPYGEGLPSFREPKE